MRTTKFVWCFMYGSNMCRAKMSSTIGGEWAEEIVVPLRGFEVVFNKKSNNWGVAANIAIAPRKKCWGVLYKVNALQFERLEESEKGYKIKLIDVEMPDGQKIRAKTFVACPERTVAPGKPKQEYLDFIWEGGLGHGLPRRYMKGLMSKAQKDTG